MKNPFDEFQSRLEVRRGETAACVARERQLAYARLGSFLLGLVFLLLLLAQYSLPAWAVLAPFVVFVLLLIRHDRMIRERRGLEQAVHHYEMELARIQSNWVGEGFSGAEFEPEKHPYAADLDLFGKGSLFEYLCRAKTRTGRRKLAGWLLEKGEASELRRRQEAVRELSANLDFQEALARAVSDPAAFREPAAFEGWMRSPVVSFQRWEKGLSYLLSAGSFFTLFAWFALSAGPYPFLAAALASGGFFLTLAGRVGRALDSVETISEGLKGYSSLIETVEHEPFATPALIELKGRLEKEGHPASEEIRTLAKWVGRLEDGNRNQLLFPFARLLFWSTHLAIAIEGWRERNGEAVLEWIESLAEIEALASLAGHAASNPENVFPAFVEGGSRIEGRKLGHPLMPRETCVRNDIHLSAGRPLAIISGSNMSGKSTYMRTVGINTVLALAGASVHAESLNVSPFRIAASIQIRDSLQEGVSKFYREILRVREMIDLSREGGPLLFLIDEIFQGTNSHDRRIAAQSILKNLVREGAMGLISTHDLALTQIAERIQPPGKNFHFEDHMEGDRMVFDYTMREGVIERGNALNLLRSIGLEIEED